MLRRTFLGTAAALATVLAPMGALAADFPSRDIRVIVPWGAGGGTDGIVRKITTIAEKSLDGATMYVENIEGGISATGVGQLMTARPDGYTIGALTYDSVVTVPWQGMLPTYKMDKLKLIARITSEPDAIIVDANSDYQSLGDLIDAAKADPGKIRIGIQNLGGRIHLTLLQLQELTGAQFKIISYPGGAAPQKEAILSDEVDVVITSLGDFSSLLEDGTTRGLVEFGSTPNPTYDVPLAKDEGVDLENGSFIVMAAPADTPDDVVAKIEGAYKAAFDSDEFQQWVAKVGVTPDWIGTDGVTEWADEASGVLFEKMDALAEAGVLSK
ncbi:tripartite tricarboxylate transporter substrate binding protein [Pseudooceanicola sediminis]|uniref:Tripartite tricarboxylate transporter substrate binding protein n=1 Tax=Pseudooceanicola sediminis TaxID=2211117 RepID=A0A399J356_9RHOB|nr:tripartite tricarboxylate transporter substrate binding protein [Pseudooceanicola sediminis]KAA2315005.1 tripartite tricarboxylate transporter substrate binding protein [Puniceibacterium sp. HSS470]RII37376.1 tripartite tricarboxylate transporter substrate binding protein [Pseudooceanicola sediminis]|tara:strand:- start:62912 stop:63892 length:981 start_codon:yes stop_codon:yes gene_type:complete